MAGGFRASYAASRSQNVSPHTLHSTCWYAAGSSS